MNDNARYTILFNIIRDGLAMRGIEGVDLAQAYQPTQQGMPTENSVTLHALPLVPLGHLRRDSIWDADELIMRDVELQTWQATYQVNAFVTVNPGDVNGMTALDLLRNVWYVMQSSATIARLRGDGLAILRVNDLRNAPFVDDRGRYEYSPSFDFTITFDEEYTTEANAVESVEAAIYRV